MTNISKVLSCIIHNEFIRGMQNGKNLDITYGGSSLVSWSHLSIYMAWQSHLSMFAVKTWLVLSKTETNAFDIYFFTFFSFSLFFFFALLCRSITSCWSATNLTPYLQKHRKQPIVSSVAAYLTHSLVSSVSSDFTPPLFFYFCRNPHFTTLSFWHRFAHISLQVRLLAPGDIKKRAMRCCRWCWRGSKCLERPLKEGAETRVNSREGSWRRCCCDS